MVEDFELGMGVTLKKEGKHFKVSFVPVSGVVTYNLGLKTMEKLKKWLEKATKPRYYVKDKCPDITYIPKRPQFSFEIIDREDCNIPIAQFRTFTKANTYCKQLNKGED